MQPPNGEIHVVPPSFPVSICSNWKSDLGTKEWHFHDLLDSFRDSVTSLGEHTKQWPMANANLDSD